MVTPKGKCEQWQCHATRDQVPQPNAALDGLPNRSVWERLKSARSRHSISGTYGELWHAWRLDKGTRLVSCAT